MTAALEVAFWISVGCILYTYAGYPLVLIVLSSLKQVRADWRYLSSGRSRRARGGDALPSVAVLVAAYNEERHIEARIRNLLALDYPPGLLRIYVGSDGSDDATAQLVEPFVGERVIWRGFTERRGKPSVINDLAALAGEDVLVFTDANTAFAPETVRNLVRHLDDPRVGCVSGELRLVAADGTENQDHVYWRYERLLKFFEGRLNALLGANGGVYALRRAHYQPIPPNTIVDDFWISIELVRQGYRCVYDPEALAYEDVPARIGDEFRRRVRIGIGNYQALRRFASLLDPRRGMVALAFFSHKVLRWLVPHCMVVAAATNLLLALPDAPIYRWLGVVQMAFYALALYGWWRSRGGLAPAALRIPLFLVSMNLALLVGFWKYLTGQFTGAWARTAR